MKYWTKWDIPITLIVLLLSLWLIIEGSRRPQGRYAVVYANDEQQMTLSLQKYQTVTVRGKLGVTVVQVDQSGVHILSSPCPHKTCIRMGHISKGGQSLICVPNGVVIRVVSEDPSAVDGVTG